MKPGSLTVILRVFLPFGAGYFLSYLFRVVNAVIAPDLIGDLGIGPSSLGLLTATYFISFAAFQLPLGLLLDRFGPRRTEALLLLVAGLGAFVFAKADSLAGLILGRALIGFGVSACLMAAFKAYTLWFSRDRWPLINGFQMACGGLGALAATSPVEAMLGFTDWRGVFLLLSGLTFLVACTVFLVVPEKKMDRSETLAQQLGGIREVFSSLRFWGTAPLITMSQAGFLSVQSLWAGPWLKDVAHLSRAEVADTLFWVAVSMIAGFILLGYLAGRLGRVGVSPLLTSAAGMAIFMAIQLSVLLVPAHFTPYIWPLFGFFGTSGIIAYAGLSQAFPLRLSGRVTTAVNLLVFVAVFCAQWSTGAIIGLWPTTADGGFAVAGYKTSFGLMLAIQIVSLVWFLFTCRFVSPAGTGQDNEHS